MISSDYKYHFFLATEYNTGVEFVVIATTLTIATKTIQDVFGKYIAGMVQYKFCKSVDI